MHVDHPSFEPPSNPDIPVWRYMNLAKFLSMLEADALHFARRDNMEDVFEGSLTKPTIDDRLRKIITQEDGVAANVAVITQHWSRVSKLLPSYTYLSCWHMNEYESVAMWKIYQSGEPQGIAVRSTYQRLSESITDGRDVYIGKVRYVDYEADMIPDDEYGPFLHKRKSFDYEREIRAIFKSPESSKHVGPTSVGRDALPISVDLDRLCETVCVSPKAREWFAQLVRDVIARYGKSWPVEYSSIDGNPVF